MPLLSIVTLCFFIIRTLVFLFFYSWLWQIKEYRIDRILIHLRTTQGRKLLFDALSLLKWLIIFISLIFDPYHLVAAIYLVEAYRSFKLVKIRALKYPDFTFKAKFIIFTTLLFQILLIYFFWHSNLITLLLADKLLPLFILCLIFFLNFPTIIWRRHKVELAKRKIASFKKLVVIGITGSYGKSSTKEFLTEILGSKYQVCKTTGSYNTEIGIAETILQKLNDNHQFFIVEMAAYKRGEIANICYMVKPQMAIITGINQQHLDLFGTLENTMKAKYELVQALPKDNWVIFNANNKFCRKMAAWAKRDDYQPTFYQYVQNLKDANQDVSLVGYEGIQDKFFIQFKVALHDFLGRKKRAIIQPFKVRILGLHNIQNILAAFACALRLGVQPNELVKCLKNITPVDKTMQPVILKSGAVIINDTFNTNPQAVLAALNYTKQFKGKKILILQPMIELGNYSYSAHEEVGKEAAKICDSIFLTNENFYDPFISGVSKIANKNKVAFATKYEIESLKSRFKNEDVVICEGKEAEKYFQILTQ